MCVFFLYFSLISKLKFPWEILIKIDALYAKIYQQPRYEMLNEMVLDSWNIGLRLYAHLVLKIGLRDLDNFCHISYL